MLRIKRSVSLQFDQRHVSTSNTAQGLIEQGPAKKQKVANDMEALERQMMEGEVSPHPPQSARAPPPNGPPPGSCLRCLHCRRCRRAPPECHPA